jgi:hypothetical protein
MSFKTLAYCLMIGFGIAGLAYLIYHIQKGNAPNYLPFEMELPD